MITWGVVVIQVRCHVFVGKDIPPVDLNGLSDPFVRVFCMTESKQTQVQKDTLFPEFFETIVFDDVKLRENFIPQIVFKVMDDNVRPIDL